jgi:uncharacterized membrane protein
MAEKEQQHRHETSKQETSAEILLARRGQLIGAALAAIVLLGGIYLVANDKSIQGFVLIAGAAVTFGGAFVYDRYQRSHQSETDESEQSAAPEETRTQR